ncbi:MAG: hypothetical protein ACXAB0_15175 [Candidatus Thorarchaeota archaeon]|jgi:hypothetical protein
MTEEGKTQGKTREKNEINSVYFVAFFIGIMMIGICIAILGFGSDRSLTLLELSSSILISSIGTSILLYFSISSSDDINKQQTMSWQEEVPVESKALRDISPWVYFELFLGLIPLGLFISVVGVGSIWLLTTIQIVGVILFSLICTIVLMVMISISRIPRSERFRESDRVKVMLSMREEVLKKASKKEIEERHLKEEAEEKRRQRLIEETQRKKEEREREALEEMKRRRRKEKEAKEAREARDLERQRVRVQAAEERIRLVRERESQEQKSIPGVTSALSDVKRSPPRKTDAGVEVRRGGEFIGNRMRFKVKVLNDSPYIITDVTVYLLSYPQDALKFAGEDHDSFFAKIEPGGFRSPTFDFLPTKDCVKGEIIAGISYMDLRGQAQTLTAKPFTIRAVCDLLIPQQVSAQDFQLKLKELECGEIVIKIQEWTPEEMFEKSLRIIDESNFFEVSSKAEETDGIFFGSIVGFAKGKYTGKDVGVEVTVTGPSNVKGASCTIQVSGEDQAMILPAIDDLRERLSAWLCPMCSSPLTLANVEELRKGNVVVCPFCAVSIGR